MYHILHGNMLCLDLCYSSGNSQRLSRIFSTRKRLIALVGLVSPPGNIQLVKDLFLRSILGTVNGLKLMLRFQKGLIIA